jgi:hypothetical protein
MKTYKVALTRTYFVKIEAQSDERAKVLSDELYTENYS